MIYQSVFGWISTILTILCVAWVFGLLIFVLVKVIVTKVRCKKEQKELTNQHEKEKGRFYGYEKRKKKGK